MTSQSYGDWSKRNDFILKTNELVTAVATGNVGHVRALVPELGELALEGACFVFGEPEEPTLAERLAWIARVMQDNNDGVDAGDVIQHLADDADDAGDELEPDPPGLGAADLREIGRDCGTQRAEPVAVPPAERDEAGDGDELDGDDE